MCRVEAEEEDARERRKLANGGDGRPEHQSDLRVAIPSQHVLGSASKGGDMDIIAVPFVFRYLCAELASMGIKISLEIQ